MKKEDKVVMGMSRKGWRNEGREGNGWETLSMGDSGSPSSPLLLWGQICLTGLPCPPLGLLLKKKVLCLAHRILYSMIRLWFYYRAIIYSTFKWYTKYKIFNLI